MGNKEDAAIALAYTLFMTDILDQLNRNNLNLLIDSFENETCCSVLYSPDIPKRSPAVADTSAWAAESWLDERA
eukprot:12907716-Prorocentrum_lima.AAC.1